MARRAAQVKAARSKKTKTTAKTKKTSQPLNLTRRKSKPGVRALRDIKFLQKTTHRLIPKLPFVRLIREILLQVTQGGGVDKMQPLAIDALQEAFEVYITDFFSDAYFLSTHAKRVTLQRPDFVLLRRLRGRLDVINH